MPASLPQARARLDEIAVGQPLELTFSEHGVGVTLLQPRLHFEHSFVSGPLARRARQSKQALLKACQNRRRGIKNLLDLTGGWGADALTLACHGMRVTMLERNPLIFAVADYARAVLAVSDDELARRIRIETTDAGRFLQLPEAAGYDCIYIDPMFPAHRSGAKPGKEMQILQHLTDNHDILSCFELALGSAAQRVVVKRPARAPLLNPRKPDIVFREKTIRFDVYLR